MTDAAASTPQRSASAMEPFFLIGAERSGTTLLRLILDHHPLVRCHFESSYLVDHLGPDGAEPDPAQLQSALAMDRAVRDAGFAVHPGQTMKDAARSFLVDDAAASGKPIVGATIHRRFFDLLAIWPQARFLHIVRDPRDVAPSVMAMGWAGNPWFASDLWIDAEDEASELFDRIPAERRLTVRFEDLVCEPVPTLTRVCHYLGCEFDDAMLSYPETTSYPPPDPSAAARWRRRLSVADVQLVEERVGDRLEALGYEPSDHPRREVGGVQRSWLRVQNRLAKFRFRAGRFGLFTVLAFGISSRLGMKRTSNRLRLRMQERVTELLR